MTLIYVVDDEYDVLTSLGRLLRGDGYEVELINSGKEALDQVEKRKPDLMLLDINMPPGLDGITVCRQLRANPNYISLPILFLTARGATDDIVEGLDAGADDYVIKPFDLKELRARVTALLRRGKRNDIQSPNTILQVRNLKLDTNTYCAYVDEEQISLTTTEYRLLRHLMENNNQTLTLSQLLQSVWDYPPDTGDPDLVRAHVRNLRKKLEKHSSQQGFIRTVYGVGYIIAT